MSIEFFRDFNFTPNFFGVCLALGSTFLILAWLALRKTANAKLAYEFLVHVLGKKGAARLVWVVIILSFVAMFLGLILAFASDALRTYVSASAVQTKPKELDAKIRGVKWRPHELVPDGLRPEEIAAHKNDATAELTRWKDCFSAWDGLTQAQMDEYYSYALKLKKIGLLEKVDRSRDSFNPHLFAEHYEVEIRKGRDTHKMHVRDFVVEVVKFCPAPPRWIVGEPTNIIEKPIFVVQMENLKKPLPWRFSTRWIVQSGEPKPFQLHEVSLTENGFDPMIVRVTALDAGIYVYLLSVVVQTDDEGEKTYPITQNDKLCLFYNLKSPGEGLQVEW